jgi:biopolymer transport protein ExbB
MLKKNILFLIIFVNISFAFASDNNIQQELLNEIELSNNRDLSKEIERKEAFFKVHNSKKIKVNALKKDANRAKYKFNKLLSDFNKNNKLISDIEQKIEEKSKNISLIVEKSKNATVETLELIKKIYLEENSTAHKRYVNLKNKLTTDNFKFSDTKDLWYLLQTGIAFTSSKRVFKTEILLSDGSKVEDEVVQLGTFSYISPKYGYLNLIENKNNFVFMQKLTQPKNEVYSHILENSNNLHEAKIDISNNKYFEYLSKNITFADRIEQGGVVGYIILSLGVLGLIIAVIKILQLVALDSKINQQKFSEKIDLENPLGRMLSSFSDKISFDELDLKLEKALLIEIPKIKFGESLLKLIATIAPLLGLLGTVTGMILTFQSITMFGTNDPKLMADGISQALVTTMLGLSVAIPLMFAYLLVNSMSKRIINILEQETTEIIASKIQKIEKSIEENIKNDTADNTRSIN